MKWGSDGGCGSRLCKRHLDRAGFGPRDRDRPGKQAGELGLETKVARFDPHRFVVDHSESNASGPPIVPRAPLVVIDTEERVSSRRSTKWSPASVLMSQPAHNVSPTTTTSSRRPPIASTRRVTAHLRDVQMQSRVLAWLRERLRDVTPIMSIGSFQRMPTPIEYSSGSLQSLNALPVS
jgi:hypothetical protein